MLRRLLIVVAVAAVAAAAPVRAWCEANCLEPTTSSAPHCPSHESAGDVATISASTVEACPVLESARPTVSARLDVQAVAIGAYVPALTPPTPISPSSIRPHSAGTIFKRSTPLRI